MRNRALDECEETRARIQAETIISLGQAAALLTAHPDIVLRWMIRGRRFGNESRRLDGFIDSVTHEWVTSREAIARFRAVAGDGGSSCSGS